MSSAPTADAPRPGAAAPAAPGHPSPPLRAPGRAAPERPPSRLPAHWLTMAAVYLMLGEVFFFSGKEKLVDGAGAMPDALAKTFSPTFLASFPGLDISWTLLGIMESAVFALVVISALRLEFLPGRAKPVLGAAFGMALLTFASLAFGQRLTGDTEGTATLFAYFGATAAVALWVRSLGEGEGRTAPA